MTALPWSPQRKWPAWNSHSISPSVKPHLSAKTLHFHSPDPGWSGMWLDFCVETVKNETTLPDTLNTDMQMGCNATQTVSLFPWEQPVRWWVPGRFIFPSPVCGAGLVGTVRILSAGVQSLGWTAGSENTSDRCFPSLIQSATFHFLCNMQGNCCCLRARLLYSEREKFTWCVICQGIKQSHHWDDDLSCTWDVLTIIRSLYYKVMFLLPPSLGKQHGVLLPLPIWFSFVLLLHALRS